MISAEPYGIIATTPGLEAQATCAAWPSRRCRVNVCGHADINHLIRAKAGSDREASAIRYRAAVPGPLGD